MVWTDSQDLGADEILYIAWIVLFDKINRLMREITILFGALPSCWYSTENSQKDVEFFFSFLEEHRQSSKNG